MSVRRPWGFFGAALLALTALMLPLGTAHAPNLADRPLALAATLAAAALFGAAPFLAHPLVAGLGGVLLTCAVTLRLLGEAAIAGNAGSGFWALVLAGWLAAALVVTGMAGLTLRGKMRRRANDLAVPLLFGAFAVLPLGSRRARFRRSLAC